MARQDFGDSLCSRCEHIERPTDRRDTAKQASHSIQFRMEKLRQIINENATAAPQSGP